MTEKEKRVIEMYQQGYRVRDIRDKEDMPLVNLYELLKRSKITLRGKGYRKITLGGG